MPHPYGGETVPMSVQDLARPQQQGWLSFRQRSRGIKLQPGEAPAGFGQYDPQRQMQGKRRPFDRPRKGKRAARRG